MDRNAKWSAHLGEDIRQKVESGEIERDGCTHLDLVEDVNPSARGCEDCLKIGDTWVHVRMCLVCGHVGCCDNSKNKHATRHYRETGHPLIVSMEPGEDWMWCYVDEALLSTD